MATTTFTRRSAAAILAATAVALAPGPPATAGDGAPPEDAKPPDVDCRIATPKTLSLTRLLRANGVRIKTTCDGRTRASVSFDISAPVRVIIKTPHHGVQDASGRAFFRRKGTKRIRLKLHPQAKRAIGRHRKIRVNMGVQVEMPDHPGWYYGDPADRRTVHFKR